MLPIYNKQQVPHLQLFRGKTKNLQNKKAHISFLKQSLNVSSTYSFSMIWMAESWTHLPPDPPQFAGAKVTSTQTTPSLNYRKTKSKNPTESEYPKPSEDDDNNNNNASKRLKD